jgi:hypothetical protein
MMGEGQDKPLVKGGLTKREMNWFTSCGRNINGEWSSTTGVVKCNNNIRRKVVTGGKNGQFEGKDIFPLRTVLFAISVTVDNDLQDIKGLVALREGKCGSHLCNDCRECQSDW